ncbi:tyrosine-protein phosphatase [Arthrobacter sp.]|uniref:tyrosine-protein phosphatase n=1 Tax=Arthrobacter sp. TaxID=1667 RepID=UPI003A903F8D
MDNCLAGFNNARDLGGLPLHGGGTTVRGAIMRSETPVDYQPPGAAATMPAFARVLDLRSAEEAKAVPHPMVKGPGYKLRPLIDPSAEALRDPDSEVTLGAVYKGSLGRNTATIAAIMTEIADAPEGTVLISCASGKDRTGMISAILLRLAGVPDEIIGEDYERTEHGMREAFAKELAEATDEASVKSLSHLQNAQAKNIIEMLEHIDETYGAADQYLLSIGLTQAQVDRLCIRLHRPGGA